MKVVKFPEPAIERWTLTRDLDNLRFDILSARSVADRLRQKKGMQHLADTISVEILQNTLAHIDSLIAFFAELSERMAEAHNDEHSPESGPGTRN